MKKALFIFCVFIHFLSNSQDLKLEWVKNLSASMGANGISSCFDKDGNVYQTGVFSRIINIDGQLTESKDNSSIFILKYDNKGSLLWSKVIGNYPIGVHKIETDISGNLIVLGYFYGETQFEPGYTISPLKNGIGGFVMSLSKYGNINWLNNLEYRPKHMDLDSSGNIYLSGFFSEDIDFDHSENISKLDRNSYSAMSLYCVKIKNNGNFEFVKNILNKHGFIQNGNLAAIKNDNSSIFLSGWYNGQFEIETKGKRLIQLNSKNTNTYLLKYNLLTDSITICTNKNIDIDGENEVKDIAIDLNGNIYLYGSCKALVNFNPKNDSTILNGNFFFSKYDSNLKLNYTKVFSSNGNYQNNNIRIDELNQIYLTGSILSNGVTDFDPSPNKFETKTLGGFILKLDYNSEFKYVNFLESSDFVINNISVKQNDLVLTGYFKGSIDFDIDTSVYKVTNNIMDCYIVKYNTCFPTLNNLIEKNCDFYIAPNRDKITKSGKYTFVIPNHKGCDSIITLDLTINSAYAIYTGVSGLDTTICEGSPIKLKGKGPAVSYSWDKGVIDNVTFTPLITDTYTVTGNDINGCSSKASVLINVAKYPDIKIINQWGRILCLSESVKLTSQSSMGGLTYCWKLNGEILKYQTNSTLTNDLGGDYSLEVSKNGCKTVSEIERVQKIITPTIDTSSILQICQGSLAPNLHSNDTVGAISWNYSSNNKDWYLFENIHDQTIKGIDIGVLNSIKYIRCSVNTPWCPDAPSNPIKLNVNQRPTVSGGLDQTVCVGTETILAGQGALQYKWNKGIENIKSFFIDTTTTFSVIGTDQNGCKDTASVTIYTFPASKIQISEPETIICNNREFMLSTMEQINNGKTDKDKGEMSIGDHLASKYIKVDPSKLFKKNK